MSTAPKDAAEKRVDEVAGKLARGVDAAVVRLQAIPQARADRLAGLVAFVPTVVILGIARWLEPAAAGVGTHTQLGLGSCAMLSFTGWPCPMCGMTTTFSLMAEGRLLEALANQPFGVVLFSGTFLAAVLGLVDLVAAKGALRAVLAWVQRWEQRVAMGLLLGMILGWAYKATLLHPEIFTMGG